MAKRRNIIFGGVLIAALLISSLRLLVNEHNRTHADVIISENSSLPAEATQQQTSLSWHGGNVNVPQEDNASFSACLLIMDDNHRLVEWLAYHWFVLPLRYLVVAIDPNSRNSPTEILKRWRKLGMDVVEWSDSDFWITETNLRIKSNMSEAHDYQKMTQKSKYLKRQNVFIKQCMLHMKANGKKWVAFHDIDEYLGYNHPSGIEEFKAWEMKQNKIIKEKKSLKFRSVVRIIPSMPPPALNQQGAFLPFLEREFGKKNHQSNVPCITIPRLQFGAIESTEDEISKSVPPPLDPRRFDTTRWRFHVDRDDFEKNGLSKVVIDVTRISVEDIEAESANGRGRRPYNPHRPLFHHCRTAKISDHETVFRINHYLGSWEAFSFRDDPRKGGKRTSRDGWEFLSQSATEGPNDWLRPWLVGFVQTVGIELASELLKNSGLEQNYTTAINMSLWMFNNKKEGI